MKTKMTNAIATVAFAAICMIGSIANAQQVQARVMVQEPESQLFVRPMERNQYHFGVQVVLTNNNWQGPTLRIVGVTPGSPACRAGLEIGDEIRTVNGRGFNFARDSFEAVRMMSDFVNTPIYQPVVPAGVQALTIAPSPMPQPIANMVVRNVRNGQNVSVVVRPTRNDIGIGAPAAAATIRNARR